MSLSDQASIIGEPSGQHCQIVTDGRTIRPFFALPHALVDECKLNVTDAGLEIEAVDPANVAQISITISKEAFEEFTANGETPYKIGVNLEQLRKKLRNARLGKRTNDPVALSLDGTRTRVEITRDYNDTTVERADEFLNLDHRSIRDEPDIADLDLDGEAEVDVQAFADVLDACDTTGDSIHVTDDDGDLVIQADAHGSDGIEQATVSRFVDAVENPHGGDGSRFSIDYVSDFADAFQEGKVDTVALHYDQEFPARLEFERVVDERTLYEGSYLVAPRISSDGGQDQ